MIQSFSYSPLERVYCDHKLEEIIPLEIESMNINKIFIINTAYLESIFLMFSKAWEILSLDAAKLNLT